MRAKRSLGQHFLKSEKALSSIVHAGELKKGDTVLEIGPGEGALTERLLASGAQLIAVEKDDGLYEFLQEKFAREIDAGKLRLIHGDILDFDTSTLQADKYKLIANIPYNITGAILRKFFSAEHQPEKMVLLVQKEVAERIVAKNGKESILSVSIKTYGKPFYVETVKAGSFAPAPRVDSAILTVDRVSKEFFDNFSERAFFDMIHAGFSSKRKKLSSNLSALFPKEKVLSTFAGIGLSENTRAEDVDIHLWKRIGQKLLQFV